jgi:hypothetical protein
MLKERESEYEYSQGGVEVERMTSQRTVAVNSLAYGSIHESQA